MSMRIGMSMSILELEEGVVAEWIDRYLYV